MIISSAITGLLLAGLVAFRMVWRSLPDSSGTRSLASIGCSIGSRRHILIALLAGLLVAAFYFLILMQHFPPRPDHVWGPLARAAASPGWSQHAWAILVLLLAPPIEEFFFRGILFAGLCRSWGQIVAAGCVTLLFIGGHATEILTYWPAIVAIGLLALGTMTARMTANSLGPAMAMHAAYNLGVVIWVYSATV